MSKVAIPRHDRWTSRGWFAWSVATLWILASLGCGAGDTVKTPDRPRGTAQIVLYLNGQVRTGVDISFLLSRVRLKGEGGVWETLLADERQLNSLSLLSEQVLLGTVQVPAGRYTELELSIGRAQMRQAGQLLDLSGPTDPVRVGFPLDLAPGEAVPIFLAWDADASIEREAYFRPRFAAESRAQELRGVVAYVTNEESDDVSIVDRSVNRVVSTIRVGRGPKGIAVTPDTRHVFVINSRSNSVTVIDVNTNRVLHEFNLEMGARPQDAVVTPNGQILYVSNPALNSISAIDATSFQVIAVIPVGNGPTGLAVDPRGSRLYVANTGSGTISAIDILSQRVIGGAQVDPRPVRLAVDAAGSRLHVACEGSGFLHVLSAPSLQVVRRIPVGPGAAAVQPEAVGSRVFVARKSMDLVSLYDPGLGIELASIAAGKGPSALALDADRSKLYVVNTQADMVTVVDQFSRRVEGSFPVGKRPYGIALIR